LKKIKEKQVHNTETDVIFVADQEVLYDFLAFAVFVLEI
jgi:hypothetical protein